MIQLAQAYQVRNLRWSISELLVTYSTVEKIEIIGPQGVNCCVFHCAGSEIKMALECYSRLMVYK